MKAKRLTYAGFWLRVVSFGIDSLVMAAIALPLLLLIFGREYLTEMYAALLGGAAGDPDGRDIVEGERSFLPAQLLSDWLLPAVFTLGFWMYKSATPGKMALAMYIVDSETGERPTRRQFIVRYIGYFVSGLPFFLGFLWVAFDKRKQGWHDKLAGTVVVSDHAGIPAKFDEEG